MNTLNNIHKLTFCALSFWKTNTGGAMAGLSVKRRCRLVIQASTKIVQQSVDFSSLFTVQIKKS